MNDSTNKPRNVTDEKNQSQAIHNPSAQLPKNSVADHQVLAQAVLAASEALGLSKSSLGRVIGKDRSRLKQGIRVNSKPGELAMLLIRCYRGLYALVDGDETVMRHWMSTYNHGTVGIPCEQIETIQGLSQVLGYLDAIRGKL